MEHLLNGVAAVEDKSKRADDESVSPSNDAVVAVAVARDDLLASATSAPSPTTSVKNEPLLAGRTPTRPLPKLPPISSLTQPHGCTPVPLAPQTRVVGVANLSPASAATPRGSLAVHDEGLCRYRNKLCMHARALKRNGELHNLCEKHRAKANQNQRKLESKRRVQKRHSRQTVPAAAPRAYQLSPGGAPAMASNMHHQFQQQQHSHHHQSPLQMRSLSGVLPSLAQLQYLPPRPPSSSDPSSGQGYPAYDSSFH